MGSSEPDFDLWVCPSGCCKDVLGSHLYTKQENQVCAIKNGRKDEYVAHQGNISPSYQGYTEAAIAMFSFITGGLICPQTSYIKLDLSGYLLAPYLQMNEWHTCRYAHGNYQKHC